MVEHSVLSQASLAERHVWGSQSRTYGICGGWGQLKPPQEDAVSPAAQAAPARTKRVGAGVECGGGGGWGRGRRTGGAREQKGRGEGGRSEASDICPDETGEKTRDQEN